MNVRSSSKVLRSSLCERRLGSWTECPGSWGRGAPERLPSPTLHPRADARSIEVERMADVHEGEGPVEILGCDPCVDLRGESTCAAVGRGDVLGKRQQRVIQHGEHQSLFRRKGGTHRERASDGSWAVRAVSVGLDDARGGEDPRDRRERAVEAAGEPPTEAARPDRLCLSDQPYLPSRRPGPSLRFDLRPEWAASRIPVRPACFGTRAPRLFAASTARRRGGTRR